MQEFVDGGYFMDLVDEACMITVLPYALVDEGPERRRMVFPIDVCG